MVRRLKAQAMFLGQRFGLRKDQHQQRDQRRHQQGHEYPRHPVICNSADPISGASMGETENTSMIAAIIRVASAPVIMSRTMARGTTPSAAPPRP